MTPTAKGKQKIDGNSAPDTGNSGETSKKVESEGSVEAFRQVRQQYLKKDEELRNEHKGLRERLANAGSDQLVDGGQNSSGNQDPREKVLTVNRIGEALSALCVRWQAVQADYHAEFEKHRKIQEKMGKEVDEMLKE